MNAFRKILHSVFLTTNIGVVLMMLVCGFAYIIKPVHSALPSFLAYAFPILVLVNLFFFFYWAVSLKPWALVSLAGLLLTFTSFRAWFPLNLKSEESTGKVLKILSYNVEFFTHAGETNDEGLNPIVQYVRDLDADFVCLQEAGPNFVQQARFEEKTRKALKSYKYFVSGEQENRFSVVFMSKYPVLDFHRIEYESQSNSSFYYDVKIGEDTIRVINNHLESNKLNPFEKDRYSDMIRKRESDQIPEVAQVLRSKVGYATVIRSKQADAVSSLVKASPYKVILCGDFNDAPGSYTYRKIRSGLLDAWVEKGNGWGNTFHEHLFLFRIDYILHSPQFRCVKMKVDRDKLSDHYPIWANLQLQ
jgi:endonuclease/exonuclease/phosphatase family metal-dependent hydrolase